MLAAEGLAAASDQL